MRPDFEARWARRAAHDLGDTNYLGMERNVIAGLRLGSILLMHENHGQTIRALPTIFAALCPVASAASYGG